MTSTVDRVAGAVSKALEILEPLRVAPHLHEELQVLLAESSCPRLRIAVVGVTSSGKSTFINGLLGEPLLPEESIATTNVPVICRQGPRRRVIVSYEDTTAHSAPKVQHHDDAVTPGLLRDLCSEGRNPGNKKGVRRVDVELPTCCLLPTLEIIDTPGTDAHGLPGHEAATLLQCLPIADIVVFMTTIQRRIQESEAKLLRNVVDHDQRVLFVMSRADTERDDVENGHVLLTREQKLHNRERHVATTLSGFDKLRDCGVFCVSSHLAKQARGDRASKAWHDSNFEPVVTCLTEYAQDLEQLLASTRIERTRAIIELVCRQVETQTETLAGELMKASAAARQETAQSASKERELCAEVDAVRCAVAEALDLETLQLDVAAELASISEFEPEDAARAIARMGERWRGLADAQQARIDELRERLREELARLKLAPGRSQLQQQVLHLEPLPDVRVRRKTHTYQVTVPRTTVLGRVADWFFGARTETREEITTFFEMAVARRDVRMFVDRSVRQFLDSAAAQFRLLLDLYVEPVRQEKRKSRQRLRALPDRPDLSEWLAEIAQGLKKLHEQHFPEGKLRERTADRRPRVAAASSMVGTQERRKGVLRPLTVVISRLWESVAIQRFVDVAAQVGGHVDVQEILLLGAPDEVHQLQAFLTRSPRGLVGNEKARDARKVDAEECTVARPSGPVKLSWFVEKSPPPELVRAACERADAIAVCVEAGQPSLGVGLLSRSAYFGWLADFRAKVLYVYGDGAVFDTRLAELVTQVAPAVARETRLGVRPWYVYEATTYDARYSDFMLLCMDIQRNGGSDRDLLRRWRQAGLSMRAPFHENILTRAFVATTVAEGGGDAG